MLVLTRRVGEEIVINGEIRVKIVSSERGRVRIAIDAPDHVAVDRQEVHERRQSFREPPASLTESPRPVIAR